MKFAMALCLFCALPAWAARPFVTDDARLTTAGSCQVESWMRSYEHSREVWALPACNPGGNLEFTVGGGRASQDAGPSTNDYVLQLKTLFQTLGDEGWAWGLALGRVLHPEIEPGPNQIGNQYVYVPVTMALARDRAFLHLNVGWLRDRASRQNRATWGLGAEYYVQPRLALIAESYGDDEAKPYWQTGLRYSIVPELLQVDTTVGAQHDGGRGTRWLSFGLRWTPVRFWGQP
jgi:hypothetical protein